jgi:hypothetical protein
VAVFTKEHTFNKETAHTSHEITLFTITVGPHCLFLARYNTFFVCTKSISWVYNSFDFIILYAVSVYLNTYLMSVVNCLPCPKSIMEFQLTTVTTAARSKFPRRIFLLSLLFCFCCLRQCCCCCCCRRHRHLMSLQSAFFINPDKRNISDQDVMYSYFICILHALRILAGESQWWFLWFSSLPPKNEWLKQAATLYFTVLSFP